MEAFKKEILSHKLNQSANSVYCSLASILLFHERLSKMEVNRRKCHANFKGELRRPHKNLLI